jgi:hypothetical protein
MQSSPQAAVATYNPKRDETWKWLLPVATCVLLIAGAWQIRDCVFGLAACYRKGGSMLTGLGMFAFGVLFLCITVRQLRVRMALGPVTLKASSTLIAGESTVVVAHFSRGVAEKSAVFFELLRHDKIGGSAVSSKSVCARVQTSVISIDGQLQATATLPIPADLRVLRSGASVVSLMTIHVESEVGGSMLRLLRGGKQNSWALISGIGDAFAFCWSGPIGVDENFSVPWQPQADQPGSLTGVANAVGAQALIATQRGLGRIDVAGTLTNGVEWRTRSKENSWERSNYLPGLFLWKAKRMPVSRDAELHLMARHHFDKASQQINGVRASAAQMGQGAPTAGANYMERSAMALSVLSLEVLKNPDRDSINPLVLCSRSELGACPVGDETFRNSFAVLSNDFGLATHLFDDARINAAMLSVAEVEAQHVTIKLQDNTLNISIKPCDFDEAVTTHWTGVSVALAERVVSYAAERTDARR